MCIFQPIPKHNTVIHQQFRKIKCDFSYCGYVDRSYCLSIFQPLDHEILPTETYKGDETTRNIGEIIGSKLWMESSPFRWTNCTAVDTSYYFLSPKLFWTASNLECEIWEVEDSYFFVFFAIWFSDTRSPAHILSCIYVFARAHTLTHTHVYEYI